MAPALAKTALFFLVVAFILCTIALLCPYWYMEEPFTNVGLWARCSYSQGVTGDKVCTWSHEDFFSWQQIQPAWWVVCQVLFCLAVFTQFVCLVITIQVNTQDYVPTLPKCVNGLFMLFSLIEILATVSHFGKMVNKERQVVLLPGDAFRNFGWAYLLACLGCFFNLLALFMYVLFMTKERKKKDMMDDRYAASVQAGYAMQAPQPYYT